MLALVLKRHLWVKKSWKVWLELYSIFTSVSSPALAKKAPKIYSMLSARYQTKQKVSLWFGSKRNRVEELKG